MSKSGVWAGGPAESIRWSVGPARGRLRQRYRGREPAGSRRGRWVCRGDRGSILPLFALLLLLVLMTGAQIGLAARHYHRSGAAQWAADAAALAVASVGGGEAGEVAAREVAAANGAEVRSIVAVPPPSALSARAVSLVFVVEVEYGGVGASAASARVLAGVVEAAVQRPAGGSAWPPE